MKLLHKKRTLIRRAFCLLFVFALCISVFLPYSAKAYYGNERMSSGDAKVVDAILMNLADYALRVYEEEADIVLDISDPASMFLDEKVTSALEAVPGCGPMLKRIYSYGKMTAEALWELGGAIGDAVLAAHELTEASFSLAAEEQKLLTSEMKLLYLLGKTDYEKKTVQTKAEIEAKFSDTREPTSVTISDLRDSAKHIIFDITFNRKGRQAIESVADTLEKFADSMPSLYESYQIGYAAAEAMDTAGPVQPSYNASAAIQYADAHWNDGVGLCAHFVSSCLKAGGVTIPNESFYKESAVSYDNCNGKLGVYVNPYVAAPALLKYLGEEMKYEIIKNPKESQMELGDIVFMYPKEMGVNPDAHVAIITKVENGQAYYSAHNTNRHNRDVTASWCSYLVKMNGKISDTPDEIEPGTKKQYRYHSYVNENGKRFVCPYAGQQSYPGTTFEIVYTEWLDAPLTVNNGSYSYYIHTKNSSCEAYGCIDPSWQGNRYMDANGKTWVCQETRTVSTTCAHAYSNSCDAICNDCGAARTVTHSYATKWSSNSTNHWHACTLCGHKKDTAKHTYDNACDTSCNICGAARTITHSYAAKWSTDGVNHWYACTVCGNKKDTAKHTYDNACDTSCNICDATRTITHSYAAKWSTDGVNHWYACTVCGNKKDTAKHTYDNACDTSCNICDAARTITHSYAAKWSTDGTNHWHACTVCGDKKDTAKHTYDNACDTSCNICGAARTITHSYAAKWSTDGVNHWYACTVCGNKKDTAKHTYDNACDTSCNICDATRTITHSYAAKWSTDGVNHWYACTVCGNKKDTAKHTPGVAATETTPQTCTACGYVLQAALGHTHKYGNDWATDDVQHWKVCACGSKTEISTHAYDHACDTDCNTCGYTRVTSHSLDGTWQSDENEHWNKCTICRQTLNKKAHIPGAAATETTDQTCTVCNYVMTPALGHTIFGKVHIHLMKQGIGTHAQVVKRKKL